MLSPSDFSQNALRDFDSESTQYDPLRLPPLLFPPSLPGRGHAMTAPNERAHSHTRAFSDSSRPPYIGGLDTNLAARHSHSDLGFINASSRFDDGPLNHFIPQESRAAIDDYIDASLMAAQYLDLPSQCSNPDTFNRSYPLSDSSASSPEATDTASSSSPRAELFSSHSSPGRLLNELPDGMDTARAHSGFGSHSHSSTYHLGPYANDRGDSRYHDDLLLPRLPSFDDSAMHHRSTSTWGYCPPPFPYISQGNRSMPSRPPSEAASQLLTRFGQYPVPDDLRSWPQVFKINQVKKVGAKKQLMACLFCRERKIGCARPPEDEPDQTCNQCARRKRKCEYPTESRRGQHTRNRLNAKKFLGLEDTTVIPPKLPATE